MVRPVVVALISLLVACGSKSPETPASQPALPASATGSAAEPASESPTAAEAAPKRPRKPFEVYSACAEVVTVSFAEDPKAPNAGRKPIAPSSSVEGPRNDDGNQTVWLLDDKAEPIAKVNVTRGMKRVEIGRSCRTLDAR